MTLSDTFRHEILSVFYPSEIEDFEPNLMILFQKRRNFVAEIYNNLTFGSSFTALRALEKQEKIKKYKKKTLLGFEVLQPL